MKEKRNDDWAKLNSLINTPGIKEEIIADFYGERKKIHERQYKAWLG